MGALPSQKYDHVLKAFEKYLAARGIRLPNGICEAFLEEADKKDKIRI